MRRETISRIENDRRPISPRVDKMLSMAVAQGGRIEDYALSDLLKKRGEASGEFALQMSMDSNGHWRHAG